LNKDFLPNLREEFGLQAGLEIVEKPAPVRAQVGKEEQ
jgi:hypothetical protein